MDQIGGGLKVILIFSAIIVVVGTLGIVATHYWPITLIIVLAAVGGFIYWKRQKRDQNRV